MLFGSAYTIYEGKCKRRETIDMLKFAVGVAGINYKSLQFIFILNDLYRQRIGK